MTSQPLDEPDARADFEMMLHVLESIPTPAHFKDLQGCYRAFNSAARAEYLRVVGRDVEHLIGQRIEAFSGTITPSSSADEADLRALAGETVEVVTAVPFPGGATHHLLLRKRLYAPPGRPATGIITVILDVSESLMSHQALAESQQRLRIRQAAIDDAIDAIGIANLDGRIIYVNRAYLDFWQVPAEMVIGRSIRDFMTPADADKIVAAIRTDGWVGEHQTLRPNGSTFHIRVSAKTVHDEHGQPLCLMAAMQDITERKLAEAELRKFKTISDRASHGAFILDDKRQIIYCNEAFAALHGYAAAELRGQPVSLLHCPDHHALNTQTLREIGKTGSLTAGEMWRRRKDGTSFPCLLNVTELPDDAGGLMRTGSLIDISDLKNAIDEVADQRERLAVTLRSIEDGVIAADERGLVTLMNPQAEALTGWTQAEAAGRPVREVFITRQPGETEAGPDVITRTLAAGAPEELVEGTVLIARDDGERLLDGVAAPIRDHSGVVVGAVLACRDITEQERLRQEIYQAHRLESLAVLAGGIAHDFNNLLTTILGGINLARAEAPLPPDVERDLATAERASLMARHLAQQLLTFSRGAEPVRRPVWLQEAIRSSLELVASGTPVATETDLAADLWPVLADDGQLRQALSNVMLNAVQAMPQGGKLRVEAHNERIKAGNDMALAPGRYVCVRCLDDGPGFDPAVLDHVFDPYFTTKPTGSGLGLTITYSVVAKHHGHVGLGNAGPGGALVTIHLPASDERPQAEPGLRQISLCGTGRILVMDDDPFVRKVVGPMLQHLGYEADIVRDGDAALKQLAARLAEDEPYVAALLDLTVKGGKGGLETLQRVRVLAPHLPVVACSGYCDDPIIASYAAYGFDGAIAKPYQVRELALALSELQPPEAPETPGQAAGAAGA